MDDLLPWSLHLELHVGYFDLFVRGPVGYQLRLSAPVSELDAVETVTKQWEGSIMAEEGHGRSPIC